MLTIDTPITPYGDREALNTYAASIIDTLRAIEVEGMSTDEIGSVDTLGFFSSVHTFDADELVETPQGTTLVRAGSYILTTDADGHRTAVANTVDRVESTGPVTLWDRALWHAEQEQLCRDTADEMHDKGEDDLYVCPAIGHGYHSA